MSESKLGKFIVIGALAGAVISLCDRATREHVTYKSKSFFYDMRYYSKNPDVVKSKIQVQAEKYQSLYEQIANDATYFKSKVDELKELSPQVKELVVDTKDAFTDAKDDYKSIVKNQSVSNAQVK